MLSLKPYQVEAVNFALARRASLFGDEMGLGKTAAAIGVIDAISERVTLDIPENPAIRQVLVVCPAYLRTNWLRELEMWLPRDALVTIEIFSYDSNEVKERTRPYDLVILDEGHYLKNIDSQRYERWEWLSRQADKLIIMTGTPIPNYIKELFGLLSLLDAATWSPGKLSGPAKQKPMPLKAHPFAKLMNAGLLPQIKRPQKKKASGVNPDFLAFAKRYCDAKQVPIHGTREFVEGAWQTKMTWNFDGASNIPELKEKLKPYLIRRLKADVLKELPPKRRQLVVFPSLPPELRESAKLETLFSDLDESNYDTLVKKLESNKVLFKEWSETRHKQGQAKIPYVLDHIRDCVDNGIKKTIIFGHHIDVLEELHDELKSEGAVLVHGQLPKGHRQDAIDVFQDDPQCRFFVGSLGACGTGVTLHAASHVVFSEFDPAPYRLLQGEDRAHRLGQREMVLVQHLVWNGSLDARMAQIVIRKLEVQNEVLGT